MFRNYILFTLFLLCTSHFAGASNNQIWFNYTLDKEVVDSWHTSLRVEMRYFDVAEGLFRAGASPAIQYKADNGFSYNLGARFFYYDTESQQDEFEYRPWLGLDYKKSFDIPLDFSQSLKWEHRLYGRSDREYESRLRYKFKFAASMLASNNLQIGFSPEIFCSLGQFDSATFNATRWAVPVTYKPNAKIVLEFVPFVQTNHASLLSEIDDSFGVLQFNFKTFL